MHSKNLTLKIDNKLESFVIVISKKVAKLAVQRNKLRRRIKEIIRTQLLKQKEQDKITRYDPGVGGYIYTRKGVSVLTFTELKEEVLELFK